MQEKIRKWYQQGLWTAEMVRNAIGKVITAEEAENIIKEEKNKLQREFTFHPAASQIIPMPAWTPTSRRCAGPSPGSWRRI